MYYNTYMKNELVTFDRDPNNYKHWELLIEGSRATIFLDVAENEGIRPGSVSYTHLTLPTTPYV